MMIDVATGDLTAMSELSVFDKTMQLTHEWVNDVAKELNLNDKHKAFQGLRATLHVLRDRLTMGEAANLGAELPILLAGFYYEGWKPESTPIKTRSQQEFLDALQAHLDRYFPKSDSGLEPQQLAQAVFRVLAQRIPGGEMADVRGILSAGIKELFPEAVRT
jgi:uncharacterized protein (DUF2267 family)